MTSGGEETGNAGNPSNEIQAADSEGSKGNLSEIYTEAANEDKLGVLHILDKKKLNRLSNSLKLAGEAPVSKIK